MSNQHFSQKLDSQQLYCNLLNKKDVFSAPIYDPEQIDGMMDDWLIPLLLKLKITAGELVCILLRKNPDSKEGEFIINNVPKYKVLKHNSTNPLERKILFLSRLIETKIYSDTRDVCLERKEQFNPSTQTFWCLNKFSELNPCSELSALQTPFLTTALIPLEREIAQKAGIPNLILPLHTEFQKYVVSEAYIERWPDIIESDPEYEALRDLEDMVENEPCVQKRKRGRTDSFKDVRGKELFAFIYAYWFRKNKRMSLNSLHAYIGRKVKENFRNPGEISADDEYGKRLVKKMKSILKIFSAQENVNFTPKK